MNDPHILQTVKKYLENTHAATHNQYSLEILDLFDLDKDGEAKRFIDVGNRYRARRFFLQRLYYFCCHQILMISDHYSLICVFTNFKFLHIKPVCVCVCFRQLLWHGSRLTNWVGILSQGLRIAPPEAPVTGYMVSRQSRPQRPPSRGTW